MNSKQVGFSGLLSDLDCKVDDKSCEGDLVIPTEISSTTHVVGKSGMKILTLSVWDTVGCRDDNIVRVYNKDQCVYHNDRIYWSLEDDNITEPGSSKWTTGVTLCQALKGTEGSRMATPALTAKFIPIDVGSAIATSTPVINDSGAFSHGGFVYSDANTKAIVPVTGLYKYDMRVQAGKLTSSTSDDRVKGGFSVNGEVKNRIVVSGNSIGGTSSSARYNVTKHTFIWLLKGDKIGLSVEAQANAPRLIGLEFTAHLVSEV